MIGFNMLAGLKMKNLWMIFAAVMMSSPGGAADWTAKCIERAQADYASRLRIAMTELQAASDRCGTSMHPATDRCYQLASLRFDAAAVSANEHLQAERAACR